MMYEQPSKSFEATAAATSKSMELSSPFRLREGRPTHNGRLFSQVVRSSGNGFVTAQKAAEAKKLVKAEKKAVKAAKVAKAVAKATTLIIES